LCGMLRKYWAENCQAVSVSYDYAQTTLL